MFKTTNLTAGEKISLVNEITKIGIQDTPLTSLLMAKGLVGKANGTVQTWREKSLDTTSDIGAIEGSETPVFYESARAELNNILEIFSKGVSISGTQNAINVTGQGNVFSGEVADRLLEIKVAMEKAITSGTRNDASLTPFIRRMDGLEKWAHASNLLTGAASGIVTEDEVKNTVKKLWTQGNQSGQYFALVNADLKEKIDALYKDKYSYIAQQNVFGLIVDTIRTNYGSLNLVLSRHASVDKMTIFDAGMLSLDYLRQPEFEALAKVGDSVRGLVTAEATLRVGSKKAVAQYTLKA
ncbi:SU10 major capsid protein [Paenibacillus wynnii]|uniref:Phage capsid protein n=1 Tax=Paenibacillus wynnii TaxID=268407 RepID=A0A098M3M9_9BACL|nr:DUF5309 family protein [Paenibacillus wynnii]KGE16628.1 phage capsid protein [Paenibacillus wynnii]MDQ0193093.1 hypothetical protein [Paenibacillus wynnii]